jgi:hypothetical protein
LPNYQQPGYPLPGGFFQPGNYTLICPLDGVTPTQLIGSSDFTRRCPSCGNCFRMDTTRLAPGAFIQTPPFIMQPPETGDANFIFP